jgi:hypothetical protein
MVDSEGKDWEREWGNFLEWVMQAFSFVKIYASI